MVFVSNYRLMKSDINPFDSQEAKPYKNDPEILAMTNLVMAYQNNDINEFEKILKTNRKNIMDDLFIREHIEGEAQELLSAGIPWPNYTSDRRSAPNAII